MRTMNRWEPSRGATTLQEQLNRVFGDMLERAGNESNLTPWAPAVDIFETEHELVVQADLPDVIPPEACYLGWQESLRNLARLVEPEINQ